MKNRVNKRTGLSAFNFNELEDKYNSILQLYSKLTGQNHEILTQIEILTTKVSNSSHIPIPNPANTSPIKGIKGLASFLGISHVTAQKLKNSGKIPFSQYDRIILFDPDEVLTSLKKNDEKITR